MAWFDGVYSPCVLWSVSLGGKETGSCGDQPPGLVHCNCRPSHQTSLEPLPYARLCARPWWQRLKAGARATTPGISQEHTGDQFSNGRWGCIVVLVGLAGTLARYVLGASGAGSPL